MSFNNAPRNNVGSTSNRLQSNQPLGQSYLVNNVGRVLDQKRRALLLIQQSLNIFEQLPTLIGKTQPQPCIGKRLAWQTDNMEINARRELLQGPAG